MSFLLKLYDEFRKALELSQQVKDQTKYPISVSGPSVTQSPISTANPAQPGSGPDPGNVVDKPPFSFNSMDSLVITMLIRVW
ncbi:hypothetical protein DPV78_002993 [Talaromyces pinophilus]|nr:hypothetical protein DPV78_002993 [Talaromyces pinophilus]